MTKKRSARLAAAVTAAAMLLYGCTPAVRSNIASYAKQVSKRSYSTSSSYTESPAVSDGGVSVYFPRAGQDAEGQLVSDINSAKKSLDIAIYSFTDTKAAYAIADAKKRGVSVRLISDRECSGNSYQEKALRIVKNAGIPIKINSHSGIMHLKVTVIDGSAVTTGSFNYTKSAQEKNDENFVVINDTKIAAAYDAQFGKMWNDTSDFEDWE